MNCNKTLDVYSDVIDKLEKIELAFEQSILIINNKIDNYYKNNKKICDDIKNIIKEQHNEYKLNILNNIINTIKENRLALKLSTNIDNFLMALQTPQTPPPEYESTIITHFNNIKSTAPDFNQINTVIPLVIPSAPTYNQIMSVNQKLYIPKVTYATNIQSHKQYEKQQNTQNLLDCNEPVYTQSIILPKNDSKKKKNNCIIS